MHRRTPPGLLLLLLLLQVYAEAPAAGGGGNATRWVWAPLCAVDDAVWGYELYDLLCFQYQDWPWRFAGDTTTHVAAFPGYMPFPIPEGPVASGEDFDPGAHELWAYLEGDGTTAGRATVQELGLVLRPEPCPNGMLAVLCDVLLE